MYSTALLLCQGLNSTCCYIHCLWFVWEAAPTYLGLGHWSVEPGPECNSVCIVLCSYSSQCVHWTQGGRQWLIDQIFSCLTKFFYHQPLSSETRWITILNLLSLTAYHLDTSIKSSYLGHEWLNSFLLKLQFSKPVAKVSISESRNQSSITNIVYVYLAMWKSNTMKYFLPGMSDVNVSITNRVVWYAACCNTECIDWCCWIYIHYTSIWHA